MKFKLCIFDLDDTLYDTSNRLDRVTPNFETMKLYPGALEVLSDASVPKILVTYGNTDLQNKKIETLGVRSFFKEILICPTVAEKLNLFKEIIKKSNIQNPEEVAVIGDRRDGEIRYGNMLGFTTIYLKAGKYKDLEAKDDLEIPNFTILSLSELSPILKA